MILHGNVSDCLMGVYLDCIGLYIYNAYIYGQFRVKFTFSYFFSELFMYVGGQGERVASPQNKSHRFRLQFFFYFRKNIY